MNGAGDIYAASSRAKYDASVADLSGQTSILTKQLESLKAQHAELVANGTPERRITRSLQVAERAVSGLADSICTVAADEQAKKAFKVSLDQLPRETAKALRVAPEIALRKFWHKSAFIQINVDELNAGQIQRHGERITELIEFVNNI